MSRSLYIFGASGHGKVVHSIASALGNEVVAFLDDDKSKEDFFGCRVVKLETLAVGSRIIVAIGNSLSREKVSSRIGRQGFRLETLVHPTAVIDPSAKIGAGTVIMAGAIIGPDSRVGDGCIINHGAVVDHDCVIGNYAHVCPGACVAGGVWVGSHSWIGIGSSVIQNIRIGERVTVGAGACVVKSLEDNTKAVGVPARPV